MKSETNANSIEKDGNSSSDDLNHVEGVNGGSCDVSSSCLLLPPSPPSHVFDLILNFQISPIYKVESEVSTQSPTPEMRFQLVSPVPNNSLADGNSSSSCSDNEKDEDDDLDYNAGDDVDDEVVSDSENQLDDAEMQENGFYPTLQPPSEYEDNSIQACLSEFTAREILSGSNSFKCDSCTERQNKNTGEKKAVYQPITKQLLIKHPPPVLILHLKRFEVRSAFSFSPAALRKADKTITFPLILDIGSFCSVNCEVI